MKILRLLLTIVATATLLSVSAQEDFRGYPTRQDFEPRTESKNDFRMRFGFDVEKKLGRKFELSLNEELRMEDNMSKVDRLNTKLSLGYKATSFLKISAGYTLIAQYSKKNKEDDYGNEFVERGWNIRHRFSVDFTGSVKFGRWKLSLRERILATMRSDSVDVREKLETAWELRHRLQAQYSFPHKPWKPYAYVELRNTLNVQEIVGENYLCRVRVAAGAEYLINSRSSFDFYYMFDYSKDYDIGFTKNKGLLKEFTTEKGYCHVLGVQYNYKF